MLPGASQFPVSIEEGSHPIDDQAMDKRLTTVFDIFPAWMLKAVMCIPISTGMGSEKELEFSQTFQFQQGTQERRTEMDQGSKLGQAEGGEGGRPHLKKPPEMRWERGEEEYGAEGLKMTLQGFFIGPVIPAFLQEPGHAQENSFQDEELVPL
jgi:hypothetical protein